MRMNTRLCAVTIACLLVATSVFAQAVPERTPIPGAWGPNGTVNDTVVVGDTLFLGGAFDYIGPPTGPFAAVDGVDGRDLIAWRGQDAETYGATPDGAGGWFVVARVAPFQPGYYVRHVRADGTTDPAFTSIPFGAAPYGVVFAGGRLYVHGGFTSVDGRVRLGIVTLDPASGALLPWDPQTDDPVNQVAVDGGTLFIAGPFTSVGGQPRLGMAALDAATGTLLPATFALTNGRDVFQLQAAGGRVFAQGGCSPTPTTYRIICAYLADGTVLPNWGDITDEYRGPILATATRVYIASSVPLPGGIEHSVRGFDPVTGQPDGWRTAPLGVSVGPVGTMAIAGARLYTSGAFPALGIPRYAAFDVATASAVAWQPMVSAGASSLVSDGTRIGITGTFRSAGGIAAAGLAALDLRTGRPASLPLPAMPGNVTALTASSSLVVAAAGETIVAFSATTGAERTRFPVSAPGAPPGTALALAIAEPTLFVGGNFVDLRGQPRRHLGAIDMRTGQATAFDPRPDDRVTRLRVSNGAVFAVGWFRTVPGYSRPGVAAWDTVSGALELFSPGEAGAQDVAFYKDRVLLAGNMNTIGTAGTAWANRIAGNVLALGRPVPYTALTAARLGDTMFVGGYPSPGWPNAGLSAIDGVSGAVLPWAPQVDGVFVPDIYRLETASAAVIAIGYFTRVDGTPAHNLAIFPMSRASAPRQMTATVSGNTIALGWQPGSGVAASSYVVEVGTSAGGTEVGAFPVGALTRVTGNLPPGTFYARVRGVSAQGTGSPGSEVILTTPSVSLPPQAPSALSATVANGLVTLSWTAAAGNATTYVVEAGTGPGLSNIGALPLGHLDTTFSTPAPPGTYVIRVRAANAFGVGPASNEVTVVVP